MNTIKELNRKIKDYENGNLNKNQYNDLINHLLDFKEYTEQNQKVKK